MLTIKNLLYLAYKKLLPPRCILCSHSSSDNNICSACQQDLPHFSSLHCKHCARSIITNNGICGHCLRFSPPFDQSFALFAYQAPITELIISLKFEHQLEVAEAFGKLLLQNIVNKWYINKSLPELIIPVPLHPKRLSQRGFNQALEIAKPIAKKLGIPIANYAVKRVKNTMAQSILPALQRQQNITNAFASTFDYSDLIVAVIDDVITTGHTITELCKVIKTNGAKRIDVWCCARRL